MLQLIEENQIKQIELIDYFANHHKKGGIVLRVYQKKASMLPELLNDAIAFDIQTDYKRIYENIKNYVVFKISITNNPQERLAYLDVLEYIDHISVGKR